MKKEIKALGIVLLLLVNFQSVNSQEVASNSIQNLQINNYEIDQEDQIENTILNEGIYTFDNGKNEVLVEIKDGYYTEYYSDNQIVKAKIEWVSENEYNLVITKINKKNLPFGPGTTLNTKILKVKGSRYYYESNLEGLTWSGKFIKVEDNFLEQ